MAKLGSKNLPAVIRAALLAVLLLRIDSIYILSMPLELRLTGQSND